MFAVAIELLAGRYGATRFNDRTEPEWPPHPARLFSAMVAAWADNDDPDPVERSALEWLERQDPPVIRCGEACRREVVTHFVPVNDPTALMRDPSRTYTLMENARSAVRDAEHAGDARALQRARAALARAEVKAVTDVARAGKPNGRESGTVAANVLKVLPDHRSKQGRTYPTVVPDRPAIWFAWPGAEPGDEHRRALDDVLARVGRIGHSSTLVACRSADSAPSPDWVPGHDGAEMRLRVPRTGLIDRLERVFAAHRGREPRTLPAGMIGYRRAQSPRATYSVPLLGGDWHVLGINGRRLPSAQQILAIARATRGALLTHGDQPPPPFISGHQNSPGGGEPTPALERPHLAVVPLPSSGHFYSDGAVFGIALVLPAECSAEEKAATERALNAWSTAGFELLLSSRPGGEPIRLTLEDYGIERSAESRPSWLDTTLAARRRTTTRGYWCRPAHRWLTVTPIALDRFPGNLRSPDSRVGDRAEAEAEASVKRACVFAGLVDEREDVRVTIRLDSPLAGVPAAPSGSRGLGGHRYPVYRVGSSGTPRACVHAEIEFARPVRGPVLVGAGRYFGYGLCLPADRRSPES